MGLFLLGVVYGSIGDDVEEFIGGNEGLNDWFARTGVSLTDAYFATALLTLALVSAGYAIQSVLRLRVEETALRAEPTLVTGLSRRRWAASHLTMAIAGSVVVLGAAGLGTGLTYGLVADDLSALPRLLGAAFSYAPALWLLVGLAAALFGLAPRGLPLIWAVLAFCFVVGVFGEAFDFPAWLTNASPFQHVPQLPAAEARALPLVILTAAAAFLTWAGQAAFRRRDLG